MKVIRLYGRLAKFLGYRKLEADVANAAEAVRFLLANFPHLEGHMAEQHYKVSVGKREIGEEELHLPSSKREVIKFVPVVSGAGTVGRIIAGVALIALAIAVPGLGAAAGAKAAATIFGTGFSQLALTVGLAGVSLVIGGVAQLLTPTPSLGSGADSDKDPRKSYSFSGVQNVSRQGVPVPVCYGQVLVGSVTISAGIDIDQVLA